MIDRDSDRGHVGCLGNPPQGERAVRASPFLRGPGSSSTPKHRLQEAFPSTFPHPHPPSRI